MDTIKIMGAGPAGLTAAITLANAGRPVIVYERAADVGTRHDGDYEGIENWSTRADVWEEFAAWGIANNFRGAPIYAGTLFGPGFRESARFEDANPLCYFVSRGSARDSFDRGLLEQARTRGVRVEFDHAARPGDVDIVASGFTSARAFAVGYNFKTRAPNEAYLCLDDTLTPKAYSYLVCCEGEATIAAAAFTPQAGMKERLPRVIEGFHSRVEFEMCEPKYFAASIGFDWPRTARQQGQLYVGEAAGFQDYIAGFGLRMGMTTGYLAARSILEGRDYDKLWRARYMPLMKAAAVNRLLLETFGNRGYPLVLRYLRCYPHSARAIVHRHYNPIFLTTPLWPMAKRFVEAKGKPGTGYRQRKEAVR